MFYFSGYRNSYYLGGDEIMRKTVKDNPNKGLSFLYNSAVGRIFLKPIVKNESFSNVVGKFMNSKISKVMIKRFIKNHNINMDDYECKKYNSFNDFFTRKIKLSKRIIDKTPNAFIAPCDAKITCYKIYDDLKFNVKNSVYSVNSIIKNDKLASLYDGGYALVFRLSPEDYHHYLFCDDGVIINNYKIKGMFHTVNPIVYDKYKVFKENTRECTIIKTKRFKTLTYVEVGALLVGKIRNIKKEGTIKKGEEKGYFEYGGSTIVILVQKDVIALDDDIIENSNNGLETYVKYGEKIGEKMN